MISSAVEMCFGDGVFEPLTSKQECFMLRVKCSIYLYIYIYILYIYMYVCSVAQCDGFVQPLLVISFISRVYCGFVYVLPIGTLNPKIVNLTLDPQGWPGGP